jgi:uncharacterized membrane protein (UPF0127 family)
MTRKVPTRLIARNIDTGQIVATRVAVASSRIDRAVGLLTRSSLAPGEALFITPCRGVHTWGMRFTIDVLALDEGGVVVDAVPALGPWRIRLPRRGAINVLELPEGSLARTNTKLGHRIDLQLVPAWDKDAR